MELSAGQLRQLRRYLQLIRFRGRQFNLVAPQDLSVGRLEVRHVLESFNAVLWPSVAGARRIVDVGAGAGFPGVPLAIWLTDARHQWIESVQKKASFLREVLRECELSGRADVVDERAESYAATLPEHERFDIATGRGIGALSQVLAWVAPLLVPGGEFIAYKGHDVDGELSEALPMMSRTCMQLVDLAPLRWGIGKLVVLRKINS